SGARTGPMSLAAYPYLLDSPEFVARHRPDVIVSAGRPGLSRPQLGYLKPAAPSGAQARHMVIAQGPGHWADPVRSATDVVPAVRLAGGPGTGTAWLASWRAADAAARDAATAVLDDGEELSEPRLARDLAAALPDGALLWAASSLPVRDLDQQMAPRAGLRVLASRGASGIDGLVSAAAGAAPAPQRGAGAPARRGGARRGPACGPGVPARRPGAVRRAGGAAARSGRGRGEQRRRRDLLAAGAGGVRRALRAGVRHPARGRRRQPGRRGGGARRPPPPGPRPGGAAPRAAG